MGQLTGKSIDQIMAERRASEGNSTGGGGSGTMPSSIGNGNEWSTSQELNRVAMSDVTRDHGILPIRPDGEPSHAFTKHAPGNKNSSAKGDGAEFDSYRKTLDSRAENYNANAQYIADTRDAALQSGSGNFNIRTSHDHGKNIGNAWNADNVNHLSSNSTFGIVWDHAKGAFRELTGFLKTKD